jgi:hypothetical protein
MKSLVDLTVVLLHELGERCQVSTDLDCKTVKIRSKHEGSSFLTITLPAFAKDFQKALAIGCVADDMFPGFSRSCGLPRFLGGFLRLVFEPRTGRLLDVPSLDAIFSIRQICMAMGKVRLECSEERTNDAFRQYVMCEQDLRRVDHELKVSDFLEPFTRIGSLLWSDFFSFMDRKIYEGDVLPKHGPGATADKLRGNAKYNQLEWTERLDQMFPVMEYLFPSWGCVEQLQRVRILEPGAERPVRVISVPKTLKSPRIIAEEPTCMMYVQQGIFELMIRYVEGDDFLSSYIGFRDQDPNRILARQGSRDGSLATLDLSEASDRVSNQLVRSLLRRFPHFLEGVDACRSRKAEVPGYGEIRLAKFASMGSALCFPFEEIVFLTLIFLAVERGLSHQLTRADINRLRGRVRVYGDDIIVPVEYTSSVISVLEAFGLKVNRDKSFWTGKFRESCGKDFYDGVDITVTRVREVLPSRRLDPLVISSVSLRNQLFLAGFEEVVERLDELNSWVLKGLYPSVEVDSPALGRFSYEPAHVGKMSPMIHAPLVKAYVPHSILPDSHLEGYGALMKFFLKRGGLPIADAKNLERAGRPVSVDIKTRWVPVHKYGYEEKSSMGEYLS